MEEHPAVTAFAIKANRLQYLALTAWFSNFQPVPIVESKFFSSIFSSLISLWANNWIRYSGRHITFYVSDANFKEVLFSRIFGAYPTDYNNSLIPVPINRNHKTHA